MDHFAKVIHQAFQNRIEAPRKILFFDEQNSQKGLIKIMPSTVNTLSIYFVDNFRKMVNFQIRPLEKTDTNYEVFGNDPKIPLVTFVSHIQKQTQCEWPSFPGAIVLLQRLKKKHPELVISINNMHRILMTVLLLSNKFLEDVPASNESFALGSEISLKDISDIEIEFLNLIDFDVFITRDEIQRVTRSWGFYFD